MEWFGTHIAAWFMMPIFALSAFFGMHGGIAGGPMIPAGSSTPGVACTMEAKECPDGSWVGRTGPSCAFAACPIASTTPAKPAPKPTPAPVPPTPVATNIKIYSITPASGPVGTEVIIDGFGFTSDNTVHFGSGAIVSVPVSSSVAISCTTDPNCKGGIHQRLTFTVPQSVGPYCPPGKMIACPMYMQLITPGTYKVYVENANGTSAAVSFTVTGTSVNSGVSINGLDAPTTLPIGTPGTWTVHAVSNSTNANLHYAVLWGDEQTAGQSQIMAPAPSDVQTSASFTHSYQRSGTYTVQFTVTDDSGRSASVSSTIVVTPLY
jgi:hypothetical protein